MRETPATPSGSARSSLVTWIGLAVIAAVLAGYLALDGRLRGIPEVGRSHPAVGRALGYLQLQPLTGGSSSIELRDLSGKVVLLNYWGPWCFYCRLEFPHLLHLRETYEARGDFQLVSISCGPQPPDDLESLHRDTARFLAHEQTDLPTYADPGAVNRRRLMADAGLGSFGFPTTVLLDQRGVIRGLWIGFADGYEREMEQAIRQLLEPPAARAG